MPKVVLAEPMHEAALAVFENHGGYDVTVMPAGTPPQEIYAHCRDADAIGVRIVNFPGSVLEACPNLKVIAKHGVGTDNIDVAWCTDRGLPVAIASQSNKTSVVEHTLMFMLALAKKLVPLDRETRAGNFKARSDPASFGVDLLGRTVLVIGVGRIGTALIPVLKAFGMNVIACDPLMDQTKANSLGCERVEDFRQHLSRADFLTVHVPLNDANRDLIGKSELAALPSHAYVINNARGGIINEPALAEAVTAGRIAGAATDVFDGEPPQPEHPFFAIDGIVLSPHTGGNTHECLERMATAVAENIIAAIEGRIARDDLFNPEILDRRPSP